MGKNIYAAPENTMSLAMNFRMEMKFKSETFMKIKS